MHCALRRDHPARDKLSHPTLPRKRRASPRSRRLGASDAALKKTNASVATPSATPSQSARGQSSLAASSARYVTFIANAVGHLACRHRFDVRFLRADQMLALLRKIRLDNSHDVEMTALWAVDLLLIDDFALEPMSREESKDIYQLFIERTGRASVILTSNRDTAEWLRMFDDVLLAQSAIDRFMNAAYDLVIEGESYRPRLKPKLEADPTPDEPVTKKPRPPKRRR